MKSDKLVRMEYRFANNQLDEVPAAGSRVRLDPYRGVTIAPALLAPR